MCWLAFPAVAASGAVARAKSAACARIRVERWRSGRAVPAKLLSAVRCSRAYLQARHQGVHCLLTDPLPRRTHYVPTFPHLAAGPSSIQPNRNLFFMAEFFPAPTSPPSAQQQPDAHLLKLATLSPPRPRPLSGPNCPPLLSLQSPKQSTLLHTPGLRAPGPPYSDFPTTQ